MCINCYNNDQISYIEKKLKYRENQILLNFNYIEWVIDHAIIFI